MMGVKNPNDLQLFSPGGVTQLISMLDSAEYVTVKKVQAFVAAEAGSYKRRAGNNGWWQWPKGDTMVGRNHGAAS